MSTRDPMDCATVDELAAPYALGAVDPPDDRAVSEHLATCGRSHAEIRDLMNQAAVLPAALEPVAPSGALRERLMASVANTPQEHRPAPMPVREAVVAREQRRPWWQLAPLPSALAAVGLAAAVGLGAWGVTLSNAVADRDAALRAVAAADSIHAASGPAGSGWVIESGGQAMFMASDLQALSGDELYELWLIDADGTAVAAGVLTDTDGLALVTLERPLEGATTFAVTVEAERVDAPTSEPVMVGALDA